VSKGMAIGADVYITKPFSTKELLAKVDQLLGLSA
jgi:DNA-binding response OmpR family regulator